MLAAVLTSIKNFLGLDTHVRQVPKRPLEEESEEEYEGVHSSEPQQKKRCTELEKSTWTPLTSSPGVRRFPWLTFTGDEAYARGKMSSISGIDEAGDADEVIVVEDALKEGTHQRGTSYVAASLPSLSEEENASKGLGRREARKLCELATRRPPLTHSALSDFRFVPSAGQTMDQDAMRQSKSLSKDSKRQKPVPSKASSDVKGYFDRLWMKKKVPSFLSSRIKYSMVQKSFRHEEKMRYRQLLQQYTEHCLAPKSRIPSQRSLGSHSSPMGMVTRSQLTPFWTKLKQAQIENASGASSSMKVFPFADSGMATDLFKSSRMANREESLDRCCVQEDPSHISVPLVDLSKEDSEDSFANSKESDSDSVIVVKEILSPTVHQNSLEEKLKEHPVYDLNWVKFMRKEYEERVQSAVKDADVTLKVIQGLEQRRNRRATLDEKVTQRLQLLDLTYPAKYSEIPDEEDEEAFIPLTADMEREIENAMRKTPASEVLIEKFHIQVTRRDIATLDELNWLNDEVINFYMNMIVERGQKNDNYPSVYAFNTFFYPKLSKSGYQSVRRWTKKVDIFSHDMVLVPIHLGMHWCMTHIDFKMRCISYYDSMLSSNEWCLKLLLEYLQAEHQDKKGSLYSTTDWKLENKKKIPQQMNGSDCGMFACKFAEYLSRRARINFDQEHMPYFRRRMVYEIIKGTLL